MGQGHVDTAEAEAVETISGRVYTGFGHERGGCCTYRYETERTSCFQGHTDG